MNVRLTISLDVQAGERAGAAPQQRHVLLKLVGVVYKWVGAVLGSLGQ